MAKKEKAVKAVKTKRAYNKKSVAVGLPVVQRKSEAVNVPSTASLVKKFCDNLADLLCYKNERYGDSALKPKRIFNRSAETSIAVRLDDKLSRIANSPTLRKNDLVDVAGYIVLLCIEHGYINLDDLKD
jgi:hypothetical protein